MSQIIEWAGCKCKVERGRFDVNRIPLDCPATWRLIASGCTVGVFQLEKKLGQDWARKIKPRNINELADLISLMRPGCLESGMAEDYATVKAGKKGATYLHPALKPILAETCGCLVYQEQAIRIAVELAGFSLAQGDDLRKGIGKKLPEVIAKLKTQFVEGAVKKGIVTRPQAEEIFGWIEKFQRYGFNKSHAVSYGMVGYQTAWLKCHFPMEFYTAYLTYSAYKGDSTEEVYKLVQDARLFGVGILPPDVRRGNAHFMMTSEGIAFGLAHIRGVGTAAIEKITNLQKSLQGPGVSAGASEGSAGQPAFEGTTGCAGLPNSWPHLVRIATELPRNVAEALVKAGACDWTGMPRTQMLAELEAILGTTTRDANGEKVEIRGLTGKELDFFLGHFGECGTTRRTLEFMASQGPNEGARSLSQMSKLELSALLKNLAPDLVLERPTVRDLKEAIQSRGWAPPQKPVANEERRKIVAEKAVALDREFKDTNTANAHAERYFLGISLTCSPADDADSSMATATCLDIARSPNDRVMSACCIIDRVRHTRTKRGKTPGAAMCFLQISDSTYSLDTVVFPDTYEKVKHLCNEDAIVLVYGYKRDGSFLVQDMKKLL